VTFQASSNAIALQRHHAARFNVINHVHDRAPSVKNRREFSLTTDDIYPGGLHFGPKRQDEFTANHPAIISGVAKIVSSILGDYGRMPREIARRISLGLMPDSILLIIAASGVQFWAKPELAISKISEEMIACFKGFRFGEEAVRILFPELQDRASQEAYIPASTDYG
jgi:hypothetical protein